MMLPKLFDTMLFVLLLFSFGALASPVAKSQDDIVEAASNLTRRYSNTRWTWYNVQTGNQVYCGGYGSNSDAIVALSGSNMNQNLCGQRIQMTYGGVTQYATIVDMCPGCPPWALDLSQGFFPKFASLDAGVIYGNWVLA